MLSKTMQTTLNDQVKNEIFSSYLYLGMSAWCEQNNYPGMAKWLKMQSGEEYGHGMKIFGYIHERNGEVILQTLDQPSMEYASPADLFRKVLEHEKMITASLVKIYEQAMKESDYPTQFLMQWFINEQVEEEKTAGDIVEQLKIFGDAPVSVMMVDRQLGMRAAK